MIRLTSFFVAILLSALVYGQKSLFGEYTTNFPLYGMFGNTLTLNCDSTAVMNFQGDLMNDNSYGRWNVQGNLLFLLFDTTQPGARYKNTLIYQVRRKKLHAVGQATELYNRYKAISEKNNKESGENLRIPGFKEFCRSLNKVPRNFSGKMRRQYLKKTKHFTCAPPLRPQS